MLSGIRSADSYGERPFRSPRGEGDLVSRPSVFNERAGSSASWLLDEPAQHGSEWLAAIADPIRLHILRALAAVSEATAADLALAGHASNQTLRRHLEALTASGVVYERPGQSDGETPGRPAARFSLHPDVRRSVESAFRSSPRSAPTRPPGR